MPGAGAMLNDNLESGGEKGERMRNKQKKKLKRKKKKKKKKLATHRTHAGLVILVAPPITKPRHSPRNPSRYVCAGTGR
jgi:hypothetical protein